MTWAPLAAFAAGLLLIPLVRRFSFKVGRVSMPRQDRWHRTPTPTLGGVAIFVSFALALLLGEIWLPGVQWPAWSFLLGGGLMFLTGAWDEFRPLSPAAKIVAQILAGAIVISLGYTSTFFSPRIANSLLAQVPNILFTFVWLIGITNAINLLDNMDGLAGGIALITVTMLGYFFWRGGNLPLLWVALALAGSLLAFLVFNFPPARIFMGDSGSLFLGFTLATLAIAQQKQQASNVLAVLAVPVLLFMLPILDTSLVTITRLMRGQSPAQGGRDHTSHRLIAFGLSERQTIYVLYGVALAAGVLAAALERMNYYLSLALIPLVLVALAVLVGYLGGLKVVASAPASPARRSFARWMQDLAYRRHVLEVGLDFILIGLAYYLAFLARYAMVMNAERFTLFLNTLPLAWVAVYLAFYTAGVYRGVWRYVSINDLVRYVLGSIGGSLILLAVAEFTDQFNLGDWSEEYPHLILAWFALFLLLGLAATRSSFKLLDSLAPKRSRPDEQQILIYGAGDMGELALRWMQLHPELNYHPVGFLDSDPMLQGRQIHGVEVLSDGGDLPSVLAQRKIHGVIIAEASEEQVFAIREACLQQGYWLRQLHIEYELLA